MSFLAQLRQTAPDESRSGVRLCYLLSFDDDAQHVTLSLRLADMHNGRPRDEGRPYHVLRQQLQNPPPFLNADDILLLQGLVAASSAWLLQHHGEPTATILNSLITNSGCFVKSASGAWLMVRTGAQQSAELRWIMACDGGQRLRWHSMDGSRVFCIGNSPFVYRFDDQVCHISAAASAHQTEAIDYANTLSLPLAVDAIEDFLTQHGARLKQLAVPLPVIPPRRGSQCEMTPLLHASRDQLQLKFRYRGESYCTVIDSAAPSRLLEYWDGDELVSLRRDREQEQKYLCEITAWLGAFEVVNEKGLWRGTSHAAWIELLTVTRKRLQARDYDFLLDAILQYHYVEADGFHLHLGDSEQGYRALRLEADVENQRYNLLRLLKDLHAFNQTQAEQAIELDDGRLLLLPESLLSGALSDIGDWSRGDDFHVPDSQLYRLHPLFQGLPQETEQAGDIAALDRVLDLHRPPVLLDESNARVQTRLRPYQWLGVSWIQHLKQNGVNGLLADDMGLGKTLQTLAHLSLEQAQGGLRQPALIVAPTSLMHNWAAESETFTPHLRYRIMHGAERHQYWQSLHEYDVVFTSYALISRDLTNWRQQALSWLILDEAQVIKNPRTQASQALRELDSEYRLCLSGTPLENHLGELHALLDFLMPGCLGSQNCFRREYRNPIERDGDENRMRQLLDRVAPFIMRRDKDQVAQDLPPKNEIEQIIDLDEAQSALYRRIKDARWDDLQQQLAAEDNKGGQQILILSALLKLRQVCCDPRLIGVDEVASAKREHCLDMLRELVDEGRAVLVFSQFTAMLDILAADLDATGMAYRMLTGRTRNRQQMVDDFQAGKAPVFLISLKAGGVGLNLTRADTVIHYDPWWNSAAEQQASDRAHRIGQDKPVFVYKLIAADTIEQKIARLQQRKAQLGARVNNRAQASGQQFALELEDLLQLWQEDSTPA